MIRGAARRVLGGGLLLWSLAQAASGLVRGFTQLLAARVVRSASTGGRSWRNGDLFRRRAVS